MDTAPSNQSYARARVSPNGGPVWPIAAMFEGGIVLLAWGLSSLLNVPILGSIRVGWYSLLLGVLATIPMLACLLLCLKSDWPPLATITRNINEVVAPMFAGTPLAALVIISILAGVGEEALFRGVLQQGLARVITPGAALVVLSALFGLVHPVSIAYIVYAAVAGLYFGTLALATDNLVAPMVAHALYDFIALTYLVRVRSTPNDINDIDDI